MDSLEEWQKPVDRRDWESEFATVPSVHQVFLDIMANAIKKISGECHGQHHHVACTGTGIGSRAWLTGLFEEELLPDPAATADVVIRRLAEAGFEIRPAERHQP